MSDWRPTCEHVEEPPPGASGFVVCRMNLFGGRPSLGTCDRCDLNPGKGTMPTPEVVQVHIPTPEERAAAEKLRLEAEAKRIETFHRLWRELHTAALAGTLTESTLDDIARQFPTCGCKPQFAAFRASVDGIPTFADTVEFHNAVNTDLGKPLMTVRDAIRLYS